MQSAIIAIDSPGTKSVPQTIPNTPLATYLRGQVVANGRAALLLSPFADAEFGTGAAAPSSAHILEVNTLLGRVRGLVDAKTEQLAHATARAIRDPERARLAEVMTLKQEGMNLVSVNERIRQVYWDIFGQRLTRIAPQLLASDRIALDCYQYVYGGLGKARSIPSPAPLSYMEGGVGPATFRRGVALRKLGRLANPFPLVKLPYSRLVTPWTLGAIPHEIGHNLQSDLGLWLAVPRLVNRRLAAAGTVAGHAPDLGALDQGDLCGSHRRPSDRTLIRLVVDGCGRQGSARDRGVQSQRSAPDPLFAGQDQHGDAPTHRVRARGGTVRRRLGTALSE